jgi:deoxyribodipyrimidine photolyase
MKASEYYEKHKGIVLANDPIEKVSEILEDFCAEAVVMAKENNAESDTAFANIINEQNLKWNALRDIFVRKNGSSVMNYDGFRRFWKRRFPNLDKIAGKWMR